MLRTCQTSCRTEPLPPLCLDGWHENLSRLLLATHNHPKDPQMALLNTSSTTFRQHRNLLAPGIRETGDYCQERRTVSDHRFSSEVASGSSFLCSRKGSLGRGTGLWGGTQNIEVSCVVQTLDIFKLREQNVPTSALVPVPRLLLLPVLPARIGLVLSV